MANVVPSQVIAVIERSFPHVGKSLATVRSTQIAKLVAIKALVSEIPRELLTISPPDYSDLTCAITEIDLGYQRSIREQFQFQLNSVNDADIPSVIFRILKQCNDEYPPPQGNRVKEERDNGLKC